LPIDLRKSAGQAAERLLRIVILTWALSLLGTAPASAVTIQTAGTPTNKACKKTIPYPSDWTIVLVCNDDLGDSLQKRLDATNTDTAFTIRDKRLTVIRGEIFRQHISMIYVVIKVSRWSYPPAKRQGPRNWSAEAGPHCRIDCSCFQASVLNSIKRKASCSHGNRLSYFKLLHKFQKAN
jgi:hypothetical protein